MKSPHMFSSLDFLSAALSFPRIFADSEERSLSIKTDDILETNLTSTGRGRESFEKKSNAPTLGTY